MSSGDSLEIQERIAGGLVGLLVGDALGVPYEFHAPHEIPAASEIEFTPPPGFRRSHAQTPPGTWSDDGAHALCLAASLLERGRLDLDDFGKKLVAWYDRGGHAVDGNVFDVGIQTAKAIRALRDGTPAAAAGPSGEQDNGNGALMRMLPLVLWHRGSDEALVFDAKRQSLVTHGHLRSQVCCALYALWGRRTLEGHDEAWMRAVADFRRLFPDGTRESAELEFAVRPDDFETTGRGSGYVVDCLRSARDVLKFGSYEEVVRAAVALGRDTDTTACVAGGIAGLRFGLQGIPARWREALRGREIYEPILKGLLAR